MQISSHNKFLRTCVSCKEQELERQRGNEQTVFSCALTCCGDSEPLLVQSGKEGLGSGGWETDSLFLDLPVEPDELFVVELVVCIAIVSADHASGLVLREAQFIL